MKLNVTTNPGWTHTTVGKKSIWTESYGTGPSSGSVQSAAWEPASASPGSVAITVKWGDSLTGNVNIDLYGTYDGTTYVKLLDVGAQIASGGSVGGTQTTIVDLASYPSGKYKIDINSAGNDADGAFFAYITE